MTEVRLITFRSATFARSARISFCTPSVKNAFSWFALRFSNGSTAMLFSGIAVAVETGATAPTLACLALKTPKYQPPTASASKQSDTSARTRTLFFDRGKNDATDGERAAPSLLHRYYAHRIAQAPGNPKVGHFELAALIHHQVCRLQITMDDMRVVVRVVERIAELAHPIGQFGRLKDLSLLVAPQTRKRVAIDVFHRYAARAFVVHKIVNAHDVFVGEFQATSRLALEIAQHRCIVNDQVGQKFERDIAL